MRKIVLVTVFLALCCMFASSLWAAQPDLAAADWSVKSSHSLATDPPPNDAVLALVAKVTDQPDPHLKICSSHFADLRHSDNLSLVVSTESGRFCDVQIIDKTASRFEVYDPDSSTNSSIDIKDIDGNGNLELIVNVDLTSYEGANHCEASWPAIYAWTGNGYSNVSAEYRGYYEQQLASLRREIAAISSATGQAQAAAANQAPEPQPSAIPRFGSPRSATSDLTLPEASVVQEESPSPSATPAAMSNLEDADCTKAEAAKIERFLGTSQNAGMSDAIQWANSNDASTRRFASDILFDIGTPDAIVYLRTLSNDSDPMVAHFAKTALADMGHVAIVHKVKRENP